MAFIKKIHKHRWAYFFILPLYLFFILFTLIPLLQALGFSFYEVGLNDRSWIGLDNFKKMAESDLFWKALINTIIIVAIVVPAVIVFSLFVSVIIFPMKNFVQSFFRMAFYLPVVASGVVISIVWLWLLNPSFGLINYLITLVGAPPVDWLGSSNLALISVMIVTITFVVGQPIILYMAALGGISEELQEAAMIDGANSLQRFWNITLPLLKPTTLFIAITQTIGVFQVFVVILLLTNGGPNNGTQTLIFRQYQVAFDFHQFGYASALGIIVIIIVTIVAAILFKLFGEDSEF